MQIEHGTLKTGFAPDAFLHLKHRKRDINKKLNFRTTFRNVTPSILRLGQCGFRHCIHYISFYVFQCCYVLEKNTCFKVKPGYLVLNTGKMTQKYSKNMHYKYKLI